MNLLTKFSVGQYVYGNRSWLRIIDSRLKIVIVMIFWSSSCTKGIKRNAINNWKSHLLIGNPIFLNGYINQLNPHTISSCNVVKSIKFTLWITVNIKVEVFMPSSKAFLDKLYGPKLINHIFCEGICKIFHSFWLFSTTPNSLGSVSYTHLTLPTNLSV